MEQVVLVNEQDHVMGTMEKMEAHQKGVLHRAISVFIYNAQDELMLQQRAAHKYHSPLLWTNTCCSHPFENETYQEAAERRLQEEMGFECPLEEKFHFIYKADVGNGLIEHELDHVFVGRFDSIPNLNPDEIAQYEWKNHETILKELEDTPEKYTEWFKIIFKEYLQRLK